MFHVFCTIFMIHTIILDSNLDYFLADLGVENDEQNKYFDLNLITTEIRY